MLTPFAWVELNGAKCFFSGFWALFGFKYDPGPGLSIKGWRYFWLPDKKGTMLCKVFLLCFFEGSIIKCSAWRFCS